MEKWLCTRPEVSATVPALFMIMWPCVLILLQLLGGMVFDFTCSFTKGYSQHKTLDVPYFLLGETCLPLPQLPFANVIRRWNRMYIYICIYTCFILFHRGISQDSPFWTWLQDAPTVAEAAALGAASWWAFLEDPSVQSLQVATGFRTDLSEGGTLSISVSKFNQI